MEKIVKITEAYRAASETMEACGKYSQANPKVYIRDNPFYPASRKLSRGLGFPVCKCRVAYPVITADLKTECCGTEDLLVS